MFDRNSNGWQGNSYNGNAPYGSYDPYSRFSSNVEYVTSIEEALMRTNTFPSDKVYFHQDRPIFYKVKVDAYGKKSWAEFEYGAHCTSTEAVVNQSDLTALSERVKALEDRLNQEAGNEKSNG